MTGPELRWVRPPQQARSQETLERLLDAAEHLVAEKGFEDTGVAEVARRAGSSVGAFYARFQDKDALLHALYERYQQEAIATTDAALEPARWADARIAEILEAVVRFLVSLYREQVGLIRAFVVRAHIDPDFHARREHMLSYVNERLSALLLARRDEIAHPDPEKAAAFGLTLVFATLDNVMLFGELRSGALALGDDELALELTRTYLAYLGATHL
ncbi:MAG TPA: TetR/AcrR family transcriptional regulator [Myxococcota bacterium]|jgi:AcrR family transcriptional regulator|nr:TetR/AcrR family transcriptional regulator [Myxococcota bacterium]